MARLIPNNVSTAKLKSSGTGYEPTGTLNIFEDGIYDIKKFAYVNVQVLSPVIDAQLTTKDDKLFITSDDKNFIVKENI